MKFKQVLKDLWRTPDFIGFAAHWVWIWCVFWSSLFYRQIPLAEVANSFLSLEPIWTVSLGANVFTLLALVLLSRSKNPLTDVKALIWLAPAATVLGTLLISTPALEMAGSLHLLCETTGSILTGVGSGILVVLWGELYAGQGAQRTVFYSVVSCLLAAFVYPLILTLPEVAGQLIVAVLPLISIFYLRRFKRCIPRTAKAQRNVAVEGRPPWMLIAVSLFFGFSFGLMKGLVPSDDASLVLLRDVTNIVAIIIGLVAVFATAVVYKMDFKHMTYQIALPLMAVGFLFLPFSGLWLVTGTGLHQMGYQYFDIILWALWAFLATSTKLPAGWIVALGMFSIQLGQLLGSAVGALALFIVHTPFQMAMFSAIIVFCFLLVSIFALGNNQLTTGWGLARPIEDRADSSALERCSSMLARRFRLSP
ncbi:MAG: LuxR family transcriptional regulator, partial [Clostridia bacterium]